MEEECLPFPGIEVRSSGPRARRLVATPGPVYCSVKEPTLGFNFYAYLASGDSCSAVQCACQHVAMFLSCPKALCHQ